MKKQIPGRIVKIVAALALLLVLVRFFPHEPLSRRIPLSTAVWSSDGELLRVTLASDDQYRLWTPLSQMSPELVEAFLLNEDRCSSFNCSSRIPNVARARTRRWFHADNAGRLEASVAADVHSVFWFDGRALIGNAPVSNGSMKWRPQSDGVHLIRVVDDHGRASEREVQVQLLP